MTTRLPVRSASLLILAGLLLSACNDNDGKLPRLSAATTSTRIASCASLAGFAFARTAITSSTTVAAGAETLAGQPIAEHCLITGKMHERISPVDGKTYAIGFEMRLPTVWNGRYFYQANGGIDGEVKAALGLTSGGGPLTSALSQGFAVLSSDAGHSPATPTFGLDPQARLDYGYQAVAKLTPMARTLILEAYNRRPDRSYFGGCSNGGRHALVAASRYASDYDGFLIGAPGYNLPKAAVASIGGAQLYAAIPGTDPADLATAVTATERTTLANAILAQCDALDGLADGMVQDREACQAAFDLQVDIPTCSMERDGSCLTTDQKSALGNIFSGIRTSSGQRVYSAFPWDAGINASGVMFWEYFAPLNLDSGAVAMIFKTPPLVPGGNSMANFDGPAFVYQASIDSLNSEIYTSNALYTESGMGFMTPPDPTRLDTLKNRGAKIIAYHGVSDAIFSFNDTQAWYEGLDSYHDGDAEAFARLYPVPGMGHCSGGPATDQFDLLTPLVAWVEQGEAPERIIAGARGSGNAGGVNAELPSDWSATRNRPLCPYPQVARYQGSGSPERAANFSCEQ